jgi:hypothetical protein
METTEMGVLDVEVVRVAGDEGLAGPAEVVAAKICAAGGEAASNSDRVSLRPSQPSR